MPPSKVPTKSQVGRASPTRGRPSAQVPQKNQARASEAAAKPTGLRGASQKFAGQGFGKEKKESQVIKLQTETVTKKDIEYLKSYFQDIDLDNSGTIDMDEIEHHMRQTYSAEEKDAGKGSNRVKFGPAFVKRIQAFIENKEEMQFTDMLRLVYPSAKEEHIEQMTKLVAPPEVAEPPPLVPEEEDRFINNMWALWDSDGSGELDHFEFRSVLRDINASQEDAEQFFEEIDIDKSGSISKQEFRDWWFGVGRYQKNKKKGGD